MRFLYDRRKRGIYMRRIVHHWNTSTYLYSRVFSSLSSSLFVRFSLCFSLLLFFFFDRVESLKRVLERVEIWDIVITWIYAA